MRGFIVLRVFAAAAVRLVVSARVPASTSTRHPRSLTASAITSSPSLVPLSANCPPTCTHIYPGFTVCSQCLPYRVLYFVFVLSSPKCTLAVHEANDRDTGRGNLAIQCATRFPKCEHWTIYFILNHRQRDVMVKDEERGR